MAKRLVGWVAGTFVIAWAGAAGAVDRESCFSAAEAGQQLRTQGKLRGARDALLECAQTACPSAVQKDCARWLGEVKDAVPSVVFAARDAHDNDLSDVSVTVDAALVQSHLDGRPVELDPGSHTVVFSRTASPPVTKSVVIAAGQKLREISIVFGGGGPALAPAPGPTPIPAEQAEGPRRPIPISSIVLGGVAAAGLVSMTALWISGRSDFSNLQSTCSPTCDPSQADPVRAKLIAGDVSAGVAVVSLGLAAWLFFTRPTVSPSAPTVGVAPTRGGATALLGLTF